MDVKSRKTRFRWEGAQYSRALESVNRRRPPVLSSTGDFVSPTANQGGGPCFLQRRSGAQIRGRGPRLADFCFAPRGGRVRSRRCGCPAAAISACTSPSTQWRSRLVRQFFSQCADRFAGEADATGAVASAASTGIVPIIPRSRSLCHEKAIIDFIAIPFTQMEVQLMNLKAVQFQRTLLNELRP
jgi:hypothetical protein